MPEKLPGSETVLHFEFSDLKDSPDWWIIVSDEKIDVCTINPGKEIDVYFNTSVKTMVNVWMEQVTYKKAIADSSLVVMGPTALTRNVTSWLQNCVFTDLPVASEITG